MRLTPRAEEVAEIVAILQSDEYDEPEDMAKAVIKQTADFLQFREFYMVGVVTAKTEPRSHYFGVFASEAEAEAHAAKLRSDLSHAWVRPIHFVGKPEQRTGGGFGYCTTDHCGHPDWAHSMAGTSRGYCILCGAETCDKYQSTKPKTKAKPRKVTS